MVTLQKQYTTKLDGVFVSGEGVVKATVSLFDASDARRSAVRWTLVLKDGKVVRPSDVDVAVDPVVGESAKTLLDAVSKIVDQVATAGKLFIQGTVA